jgi:hypothetical protein
VDGVHLGTIGVEVGGVDLRPCDDARSILCDLVMHGTGLSTPGRTAPGAAIPALGSIGVVGLWVARLPLLGPPPPGSAFQPVNWGQEQDSTKYACS